MGETRETEYSDPMESLLDSEGELKQIVDSIADGVIVTDLDGKIGDYNRAARALFGFPPITGQAETYWSS